MQISKSRSIGKKIIYQKVPEIVEPVYEWIDEISNSFMNTIEKPIQIRERIIKNQQPQRCLDHNILYSIYCTICRKLLCASCMYNSMTHRKHRVIPIDNAMEQIKQDIKTFDAKIAKLLTQSDQILHTNSDCLVKIERQFNPLIVKMQQFYENLRALMKAKEKEHMDYLRETRDQIRGELSTYSKQISRMNHYVTEKFKTYTMPHMSQSLLIPSRNILQNLLSCSIFFDNRDVDYDRYEFRLDPQKIKSLQEQIIIRISGLAPLHHELAPPKIQLKKIENEKIKQFHLKKYEAEHLIIKPIRRNLRRVTQLLQEFELIDFEMIKYSLLFYFKYHLKIIFMMILINFWLQQMIGFEMLLSRQLHQYVEQIN